METPGGYRFQRGLESQQLKRSTGFLVLFDAFVAVLAQGKGRSWFQEATSQLCDWNRCKGGPSFSKAESLRVGAISRVRDLLGAGLLGSPSGSFLLSFCVFVVGTHTKGIKGFGKGSACSESHGGSDISQKLGLGASDGRERKACFNHERQGDSQGGEPCLKLTVPMATKT